MAEVTDRGEKVRLRRFRPYPEYRDSGVEWLGKIPAHWEVTRLRQLVGHIEQGWSPDCENREADADEWGVLKAGCVNRGAFLEFEHKALPSTLRPIPALEIRKGDLLMSRASGSRDLVGSVAVVPECRPHLLLCDKVFRLHTESTAGHRRFIAYAMNSRIVRWQIESVISGGSGLAINVAQKAVKDLVLVHPPLDERQTIGGYLDRETAKIDALVARKERLIELLQEKRAALITRAVTRGLDPNVLMKDSGVEWLGEIPAHWEVKRVDHTAEILRGKFTHRPRNDPSLYDGRYPFIQTGDVARAQKVITGYRQTLNEQGFAVSKMFPSGTLVMTIAANIGDVAVLDFAACFPDSIVGFIPRDGVHRDYLYYVFLAMKPELLREAPVNTQGNLNVERVRSPRTQVTLPNTTEQIAIIDFLDRETTTLDALIAKVREAIDHLKEFRTALISAAVTGKIDVRTASAEATVGQGGTR